VSLGGACATKTLLGEVKDCVFGQLERALPLPPP
jgi:hypothetical protein